MNKDNQDNNNQENDIIDMLSSDDSESEDEYSDTETKLDETNNEDLDSEDNISDEDEQEQEEEITGIIDIKQQKVFTNNIDNYKINKLKKKQSLPFLTKFEKSLILGIRLKQLTSNGKPMVSTHNCFTIRDILKKEFIEKKIPLLIRRYLPNNSYEDWKLNELTYSADF